MKAASISHILLPTRPQPDTIVAIFLLRTFGEQMFPGITGASVSVKHSLDPGDTFESLLAAGTIPIDVGGGPFDHHNGDKCASELVAKYLGIEHDPALARLLQYARRDDKEGKGTISTDAVDRAFGLSGLIAALNKMHIHEPQRVVDAALPLLEAHYRSAKEHHVELPLEIEQKKRTGEYQEAYVTQAGKKIKVVFVVSDKPSMPTYLRSQQGPRADLVVQRSEHINHVCILSQQVRRIDLSKIMALIRLREGQLMGLDLSHDYDYLEKTGRIPEVPYWYFDPATNSLLNGGPHNRAVAESHIAWNEMKKIVEAGVELGGIKKQTNTETTYYLSINIPEESATEVISHLTTTPDIKVHQAKNLHVTVEYLGPCGPEELQQIVASATETLSRTPAFSLFLKSSQLQYGAPEGYSNAWFLHLGPEEGADQINALRNALLSATGKPQRDKSLHITLATSRSDGVSSTAVSCAEPFTLEVPVTEIVLMENSASSGKRVYRVHSIFHLS